MPPTPENNGELEPKKQSREYLEDGKLVSEITGWYEMVTKNAEGEAEVHRLYKHSTKQRPAPEDTEYFPPAVPPKITPSRRKPIQKDNVDLFVFSDPQFDYRRVIDSDTHGQELIPIHHEPNLAAARFLCRDLRPEYIINTGDTVDNAALSRFKLDSDDFHRTMGPSYQRANQMYAEYRADHPDARIIEVDSNHNTRLRDFVLKNMPQIYGMKRPGDGPEEYPIMTYPYLANLNSVGVEWISGYGAAEFVYGDDGKHPPIVFKHGNMVASNSSTAAKESRQNPETHIVRGHGHRMESHYRTNRRGQYLASFMVGALCKSTGEVPGYHSAVDDRGKVVERNQDWQASVLHIEDYGDGHYVFNQIPIINGIIYYRGKRYDGNE